MQLFKEPKINFLGKKYFAITLSVIVVSTCLGYMLINGINLGIDFIGGHLIHLKFNDLPEVETIRNQLTAVGYPEAIIQLDREHNEVMIRVQRDDETVQTSANSPENTSARSQDEPMPEDESASEETSQSESETPAVDYTVTQVQTFEVIATSLRTAKDKADIEAGKLDLNLIGKTQLVDLLIMHDPLEYLQTESTVMTPEAFARREYQKIAVQLIDEYRDRQTGGIMVNMDEALASLDAPHHAEELRATLEEHTFVGNFSRRRTEMVSAVVGSELGEKATWAIVFSIAGILGYIWFRFNNRFSVAAIVALVHDVIIALGIFTIVGREVNLPIVAALLTIAGYSINDTIVIFVRIRENLTIRRREAKEDYEGLLNVSINSTLSRTVLTSVTTLVVVLFLFFMGGSVINDFAFMLLIGVMVGTYSSIFVASPVLAVWQKITGTMGKTTVKAKATA